MKRYLLVLLALVLIFSLSIPNVSFACAKKENMLVLENMDIVYNYIETLDNVRKNIELLGKNAIQAKQKGDTKLTQEYTKDIEYVKNQLFTQINTLNKEYLQYKDNETVANGLLYVGIILSEYRFALAELGIYLQTEGIDKEFSSLGAFFNFYNEGNKALASLKSFFPK